MATTYTPNLDLPKHSPSDPFDITLINDMADKLDANAERQDAELSKRDRVVNLLDNSDFRNPVNQRGVSGTITATGYFLDRWKLTSGSVTINSGSITLNGTIEQILEKEAVTATAACDGGATATYDNDTKTVTITGSNTTITWAALYEGGYTVDTLPTYMPRGYAAELAECRRYYRRYTTFQLPVTITVAAWAAAAIDYTTMRVTPSVTYELEGLYVGNTKYTSVSSVTTRTLPASELVINVGASIAANQTGAVRFNSLELSADL